MLQAAGGTCQWAAQMAKICGYKVIATCAARKADIARATGADHVIELDEVGSTLCMPSFPNARRVFTN
jgi:NADPH:quinone reductase-like Zn-dependent oxidoreductase